MPKTLYVIDGHSLAYQAYHAMGNLTAPDGRPTGAVYGFVNMLRKLVRDHVPDHLIITFDTPEKTFRHEQFEDYKANRPGMPDDLREQLGQIKRILAGWPLTVLEAPGYEADDLLATLCRMFTEPALRIVLVTADKDAHQLLVEGRVEIFDARRGAFLTANKLPEKSGIRPDQVVDFLTMVGDAVDNVPGIKRIGKKTAVKLLAEYDSLERIVEAAEQLKIKGKVGENIREAKESIPGIHALVQLDDQVPLTATLTLAQSQLGPPDPLALTPIFRELGFTRLLDDLGPAPTDELEPEYKTADTETLVGWVLAQLKKQPEIGLAAMPGGIGVSWQAGTGWYLPLSDELRKILASARPAKVGHDMKALLLKLARQGVRLGQIGFDCKLAAYLLNPTLEQYSLKELSLIHLGIKPEQIEEDDDLLPLLADEQAPRMAAQQADLALRLAAKLRPRLQQDGLDQLLEKLEIPLLRVLAEMEQAGICIDAAALKKLGHSLREQIALLREKIFDLAGETFNIDSPKQLGVLLFETLGLPPVRKTQTGWSTDAAVLQELSGQHPLPGEVLAYRQLVKLLNTYVDALPNLVDRRTGRIHTSFNQATTATGRLSSSNPNLQNIPIRTALGRPIRAAFIAGVEQVGDDGGLFGELNEPLTLISADYSQVELRILAHVSGDPALREAFEQGLDIHRAVAARIAGVPESEVTKDQRSGAKTVNFGIIYGQTPFGLSQELGITQAEAKAFIETYFARFPQVETYIETVIAEARLAGSVRTLNGRVRYLPDINSKNPARRAFAERTAVNTVIQGTAADLIKLSMIRISERLAQERLPASLLLSIHDELLFECRTDRATDVARAASEEMVAAMTLDVPLVVDVGIGPNWLEAGSRQALVAG